LSWNLDLTGGLLVDFDEEGVQLISFLGRHLVGGFWFGVVQSNFSERMIDSIRFSNKETNTIEYLIKNIRIRRATTITIEYLIKNIRI